jgi:hypothetical protein
MFIYANGDSFTRGSELANYLLPKYPGNTSTPVNSAQLVRNERWLWYMRKHHQDLIKTTLEKEITLAYPQKVANKLGVECYNNAYGGSSIDRIARTTVTDLAGLKNEKKDIVAIIGTTSIFRMELPGELRTWHCGQPTVTNDQKIKPVTDYYIKYYSEYHATTNYYKNLIFIRDFCKLNHIRLILVDVSHNDIEIDNEPDNDLKNLKQYLDLKYDFDISRIAHQVGGDIFCPCGHFTESVHDRLAEEIVKIL